MARLKVRNESNSKKQFLYRANNIEKVRAAEKVKTAATRARSKEALQLSPFVAIDAEGVNLGARFAIEATGESSSLDLGLPEKASGDSRLFGQDHRTFLWGASSDGGSVEWLGVGQDFPLRAKDICEWLVSLPKKFPLGSIFVMFAAGYDWTQIFREMPYEKAWELWNGLPWVEHDHPTGLKPNRRRLTLWRNFGLRVYPGKYLEIGKFRDPHNNKDAKGNYNFESKIKINDTFGFFQSTFIKAATGFGGDFLRGDELEVLTNGKSRRFEFAGVPFAEIQRYTLVELRVLSRMMTKMRAGLKEYDLRLGNWHGAGCIAEAMMKKDRLTDYYPDMSAAVRVDDLSDPLALALRTYFGGRVEMFKQGVHAGRLFNYDISSAYPHILRQLPNMRNGEWRDCQAQELFTADQQPPTHFSRSSGDLEKLQKCLREFSLVSMVRVQFNFPNCHRAVTRAGRKIFIRTDLPWFPLPVRVDDGTIYFPRHGQGFYMVEEVRAMLRWAMRVYTDAKADERPMIALASAKQFIPINSARPFKSLVERGFTERAAIIQDTETKKTEWEKYGKQGGEPYDVREKVLKLGLNSIYGKTAQSKGARVSRDGEGQMRPKPPPFSNMFYAAAVTAGTRAMLLDAACNDVDAVIMFATDGICSTRELPGLAVSKSKTLGAWEMSVRQNGVFVKARIYSHEPYVDKAPNERSEILHGKRATKMRGIRPASLPQGKFRGELVNRRGASSLGARLPFA